MTLLEDEQQGANPGEEDVSVTGDDLPEADRDTLRRVPSDAQLTGAVFR